MNQVVLHANRTASNRTPAQNGRFLGGMIVESCVANGPRTESWLALEPVVRKLLGFVVASFLLGGASGCSGDGSDESSTSSASSSSSSSGSTAAPADGGAPSICAICDKAVRCCFAQETYDAGDCPGYSTASCESQIVSEQHENVLFCTTLLGIGAEAGIPACI